MAAQWFCKIAGKEFGPLTPDELHAMVDEGSLTPNHQVRRGADGVWVKAAAVKGLFSDGEGGSNWDDGLQAEVKPAEKPARPAEKPAKALEKSAQATEKADKTLRRAKAVAEAKPAAAKPVKPLNLPMAETAAQPPPPPPTAPPVAAAPAVVVRAVSPRAGGLPQGVAVAAQSGPMIQVGGAAPAAAARNGQDDYTAARKKKSKTPFLVGVGAVVLVAVGGLAALGISYFRGSGDGEKEKAVASKGDGKKKPKENLEEGLGDEPAKKKPGEEKPAEASGGEKPAATPATPAEKPPSGEIKWVNAAKDSIRRGDIEVKIKSVTTNVTKLRGIDGRRFVVAGHLTIALSITNHNAEKKPTYTTWGRAPSNAAVALRDDEGRPQRLPNWRSKELPVFTGQTEKDKTPLEGTVEDLLIYTKPTQKFKSLRLSLPGENIGSAEALGFEIPLAMIEEFKPPTEGGEGQSADSDDAQPGKPMPTGVPEINRGIEDEEKKGPGKTTRPGKEQDDPDGDVSKINKDIEATVPGEAPSGPSGVKPPPGDDPNAGAKKPPKGKK